VNVEGGGPGCRQARALIPHTFFPFRDADICWDARCGESEVPAGGGDASSRSIHLDVESAAGVGELRRRDGGIGIPGYVVYDDRVGLYLPASDAYAYASFETYECLRLQCAVIGATSRVE
jgi:hypothetical protein